MILRDDALDFRGRFRSLVGQKLCDLERLLQRICAGGQNPFRRRPSLAVVFVDSGGIVIGPAGGEGDRAIRASVMLVLFVTNYSSGNRSSTAMVQPGTAGSASAISPRR